MFLLEWSTPHEEEEGHVLLWRKDFSLNSGLRKLEFRVSAPAPPQERRIRGQQPSIQRVPWMMMCETDMHVVEG